MEEGVGIVQPICTMCLGEFVQCVTGGEREERRNANVKTLLNLFLRHGDEVPVGLVKYRLQG